MKKSTVKLTKTQEKRVAILKDAVAQIRLEAYKAKSSTGYVDQGNFSNNIQEKIERFSEIAEFVTGKPAKDLELKKYIGNLISKKNPCQVCAKGALLISSIRKFNNLSIEEATECDLNGIASEKTEDIFGEENADLMENYFEENFNFNVSEVSESWSDLTDTERILKIFNNAIRNKGTFKPKLEK